MYTNSRRSYKIKLITYLSVDTLRYVCKSFALPSVWSSDPSPPDCPSLWGKEYLCRLLKIMKCIMKNVLTLVELGLNWITIRKLFQISLLIIPRSRAMPSTTKILGNIRFKMKWIWGDHRRRTIIHRLYASVYMRSSRNGWLRCSGLGFGKTLYVLHKLKSRFVQSAAFT